MRFAEKSFEIRFCAALSAALMPFNRNPQWFGLTQAQERKAGVDAMVRQGGRLLIFQFKAAKKQNASNSGVLDFSLETGQASALANFSKNHLKSTFYIFPGHATVLQASAKKCPCLLAKSYWVTAHQIENTVAASARLRAQKSVTARLDTSAGTLYIHNASPKSAGISASTTCAELGCFCPPLVSARTHTVKSGPDKVMSVHMFVGFPAGWDNPNTPVFPPKVKPQGNNQRFDRPGGQEIGGEEGTGGPGIPIGEGTGLNSAGAFEEMLGEYKNSNLRAGVYGLFWPDSLS